MSSSFIPSHAALITSSIEIGVSVGISVSVGWIVFSNSFCCSDFPQDAIIVNEVDNIITDNNFFMNTLSLNFNINIVAG